MHVKGMSAHKDRRLGATSVRRRKVCAEAAAVVGVAVGEYGGIRRDNIDAKFLSISQKRSVRPHVKEDAPARRLDPERKAVPRGKAARGRGVL